MWKQLLMQLVLGAVAVQTHAAGLIFYENFDVNRIEDHGWAYAQGFCNYNQPARTEPCPWLDITTASPFSGTKSLHHVYNQAWDESSNNAQAVSWRAGTFAVRNMWTSHRMRLKNWTYAATPGMKHLYYKTDLPYAPTHVFGPMWCGHHTISDTNAFPDNTCGHYGYSVQGWADTCPSSGSVPGQTCILYANKARKPIMDEQWHCLVEHVNYGTPGQYDGSFEVWVDGVKTLEYLNKRVLFAQMTPSNNTPAGCTADGTNCPKGIPMYGYNGPLSYITLFQIFKQNGGWTEKFIDDVRFSDTTPLALDCGGGTPVPSDSTPPIPPQRIQVSKLIIDWLTKAMDVLDWNALALTAWLP